MCHFHSLCSQWGISIDQSDEPSVSVLSLLWQLFQWRSEDHLERLSRLAECHWGDHWVEFVPSNESFSLLFIAVKDGMFTSLHFQEWRTRCFSPILRFFSGDSKWFNLSPSTSAVPVRWISWSIPHLEMVLVRSHRRMAQSSLSSPSTVPIGSMKMKSEILPRLFWSFVSFVDRLFSGVDPLRLFISIRDREGCVTEWTNLSSISVPMNSNVFDDLFNSFVRLLTIGNQNEVEEVLISLSSYLNQRAEENLQQAISSRSILHSFSFSVRLFPSTRTSCRESFHLSSFVFVFERGNDSFL